MIGIRLKSGSGKTKKVLVQLILHLYITLQKRHLCKSYQIKKSDFLLTLLFTTNAKLQIQNNFNDHSEYILRQLAICALQYEKSLLPSAVIFQNLIKVCTSRIIQIIFLSKKTKYKTDSTKQTCSDQNVFTQKKIIFM